MKTPFLAAPTPVGRSLLWLRVEGLVALLASVVLYAHYGRGWLLFAILLFAPDLSMIGYIRGSRVGAVVYNVFHTYALPLALGIVAVTLGDSLLVSLALIGTAHIGLDRALGFGLKLPTGFKDTHLGRIGGPREEYATPEKVSVPDS